MITDAVSTSDGDADIRTTGRVHEATTPAMGATAHLVVVGGSAELLRRGLDRLVELERTWSRFLPDSEVSRYNASLAAGRDPEPLSVDTQELFDRAAEGFAITSGRFDPYLLADVIGAGYRDSLAPEAAPLDNGRTALPAETPSQGFDPGGLGKGLAADVISGELMSAGAEGVLVGIGGDIRVRGASPDGGAWRIDIEDPRSVVPEGTVVPGSRNGLGPPSGATTVATVRIAEGAVATSSQMKRRWVDANGEMAHHLIDPRTHRSALSPVLAATVIAATAWQAEILTKVAVLDGAEAADGSTDAGLGLIESLGAAALVVTEHLVETTSRWSEFGG